MDNKKTNEWKEREVGALWKRKGTNTSYCTGYIVYDEFGKKVQQRVVMFSNKNKNNEKAPDFIIYLSKEDGAKENAGETQPKTKKAPAPANEPANSSAQDDDIPL